MLNSTASKFETQLQQVIHQHQQGHLLLAENEYRKLIQQQGFHYDLYHLYGLVNLQLGKLENGKFFIQQIVELKPEVAEYQNTFGYYYLLSLQPHQAINHFKKAIKLNPKLVQAYINLSKAYQGCNQTQQAIDILTRLLKNNQENLELLNDLGILFAKLQDKNKANEYWQRALKINSNYHPVLTNQGAFLVQQGDITQAVPLLEHAVKLAPNDPSYLFNLAIAYKACKHYDAAIDILTVLIKKISPENTLYLRVLATLGICSAYSYLFDATAQIKQSLKNYQLIDNFHHAELDPFSLILLEATQETYFACCDGYVLKNQNGDSLQKLKNQTNTAPCSIIKEKQITIAYLSADFNQHPIGIILQNLLKHHSFKKFKILAFGLNQKHDQVTKAIKQNVTEYIDVSNKSILEIKRIFNHKSVDILIDLGGYTENAKPQLLAHRLAPKQVHWLGYPASLGSICDYFLSHQAVIPTSMQKSFKEKVIYLPSSWYAFDKIQPKSLDNISRNTYHLPEKAFIYCCFSQPYRITKQQVVTWAEILKKVEHSVLWLSQNYDEADKRLLAYFKQIGIAPSRIIFAPKEKMTDTWRHQLADCWLDTFNFSSGTSTIFNLLANLPMITLAGNTPQSRSCSGLLSSCNLEDCIANDLEEYVNKAVNLAKKPVKLARVKQKISNAIAESTLFNPKIFMQEFEQAITSIYQAEDQT